MSRSHTGIALMGVGALVVAVLAITAVAVVVGLIATVVSVVVTVAVFAVFVLAIVGLFSMLRGSTARDRTSESRISRTQTQTGTETEGRLESVKHAVTDAVAGGKSESDREHTQTATRDPERRLRERYIAGELDDAEFERRMEQVLETEDVEERVNRMGHGGTRPGSHTNTDTSDSRSDRTRLWDR